jgi:hypothetical protein
MAKTTYVDIPAGQEDNYYSGLNQNDRFLFGRIVRKDTLLSRKRVVGLTQRSLLPQIAVLWNALSDAERLAWKNAGAKCNLTGWRLFVQDQCIRIKNEIAGVATPSLFHQSWVGQIHIEAPADEIKIAQLHPRFYWVSRKVVGRKGMYEPVKVTEDVTLPLKIGLSYKSNLTEVSSPTFAKLYVSVWHSYQGENLYYEHAINLDYIHGWQTVEATLSYLSGYVVGYNLYIHLSGLTGDLFFDNVKAEHSVQNWARDPACVNIDTTFTRAFFQVPKHWVAITLPEGAEYDSIYPSD